MCIRDRTTAAACQFIVDSDIVTSSSQKTKEILESSDIKDAHKLWTVLLSTGSYVILTLFKGMVWSGIMVKDLDLDKG